MSIDDLEYQFFTNPPAGGGGGIASVAAGDATITVDNPTTTPSVKVGVIPESKVTNLVTDLGNKSATGHGHAESDIASLAADLTARELTANKGAASGYMGLDANSRGSQSPKLHASSHLFGASDDLSNNFPVVVLHGATAGTARPATTGIVLWVGTVTPSNAVNHDWYYDESQDVMSRYTGSLWVFSAAGELAYAENVTGTGTALTGAANADISGVSVSVPACTRPVHLIFGADVQQVTNATVGRILLNLIETTSGSTTVGIVPHQAMTASGATAYVGLLGRIRLGPVASTRTFKLNIQATGATPGNITTVNAVGWPSFILAEAK